MMAQLRNLECLMHGNDRQLSQLNLPFRVDAKKPPETLRAVCLRLQTVNQVGGLRAVHMIIPSVRMHASNLYCSTALGISGYLW